jgi:uncharacterized membrane protein
MEALFVLLALGVIAVPFVALVLGLMARTRIAEMREEMTALKREVAALSSELGEILDGSRDAAPSPWKSAPQEQAEEAEVAAPEIAHSETPEPPEADETGAEAPSVPGTAGQPPERPRDLETLIGTRWTVLLGGLAVALGAVLLVRYSIEAGLLGPGARVAGGALLAAALLGGGEWLRRRDKAVEIAAFPQADIPGVLTGAGAVAAFATIYAAYGLYGFIGPATAFVALTLAGLATLALSAVHGPKLAALGVVGSYATPLLVSTQEPNAIALALHTLVVSASVLAIARIRAWLWLAFAGVAGGAAWTLIATSLSGPLAGLAGLLLCAGLAVAFAVAFLWNLADRSAPPQDRDIDRPALIAFAVIALATMAQIAANVDLPLIPAALAVSLVLAGSAAWWPAAAPAALIGGVVALFSVGALELQLDFNQGLNTWEDVRRGLVPVDTAGFLWRALLLLVPPAALALAAAWVYGASARKAAGWMASAASAIAFLGLVALYVRVSPFETRPLFGAAGLALALAGAGLTERFARILPEREAGAPAAFATGGVAALGFAIAVTLDAGWMPLAFSLVAAGIAWVHSLRPVIVLPWLSLLSAAIGAATLWFSLPFTGETLGTTILFNKLILLSGLPAAAVLLAGHLLRRDGRELPGGIATAFGLALAAIFVSLQIRHAFNGGEIAATSLDLPEASMHALAGLGFAAGLQRISTGSQAPVFRLAAMVAGALSAAWIAIVLLVLENPVLSGEPVGARFLANWLAPGYLFTGLATAALALQARGVRPRWHVLGLALLAGLLLFSWVSLSVRHWFQGEFLGMWRSTGDVEYWTYSAAWLVSGALLLALGGLLRSRAVRAASGVLIALTVAKVFLLDLSQLEGALRAFSFIGLGLSLLAIGRFYQRILAGPGKPPAGAASEGGGENA